MVEKSFPSWSFDHACQFMEWNELVDIRLSVNSNSDSIEASDFMVVGVLGTPGGDPPDKSSATTASLQGIGKTIDDNLGGALTELMDEQTATFKNGAKIGCVTSSVRIVGQKGKRYALLGLGPSKTAKGDDPDWKGAGMILGKSIALACSTEKKITSANVALPGFLVESESFLQNFSTAFHQTMYSDNRYRTGDRVKKNNETLKFVTITAEGGEVNAEFASSAIETGKTIALGVTLTRDIVNAPHNVLNSESLAETAKRVAAESNGRITCKILEKEECEALGMGSYLGVARGS